MAKETFKTAQRPDGRWDVWCVGCDRKLVVDDKPKKPVMCKRCGEIHDSLRKASKRGFKFGV